MGRTLVSLHVFALGAVIVAGTLIACGGIGARAAGEVLYVKGNNVNIRSGPGTDTNVVTKLNQGHKLTVVGRKGRWYRIRIDGAAQETGWIRDDLISATPLREREATPKVKPPSVAELSTPEGVVKALAEAPRERVLEAFRVAIKAADKPCGAVVRLTQTALKPEGVYYVVGCRADHRYSVLVKPDGKMGTKVTACGRPERAGGRDPCDRG